MNDKEVKKKKRSVAKWSAITIAMFCLGHWFYIFGMMYTMCFLGSNKPQLTVPLFYVFMVLSTAMFTFLFVKDYLLFSRCEMSDLFASEMMVKERIKVADKIISRKILRDDLLFFVVAVASSLFVPQLWIVMIISSCVAIAIVSAAKYPKARMQVYIDAYAISIHGKR